jgi:hypothetical protein
MKKGIEKRPELNSAISPDDFQSFYWLKTELASFCQANGISASGGKIEIAARIEQYLSTGKVVPASGKPAIISNFDWRNAELDLNTKLTDNYTNTENVRAFMTFHIGSHFRFNTGFMNWAKANAGKSLNDAIDEWKRIYTLKRNKEHKSEIAPQFEYNRYIRDFMADNPGKTRASAIYFWKLKRQKRGDNNYSATDYLLS